MIELLPFQANASDQIIKRYTELATDKTRPFVNREWAVPFYQALSSLTGSGKTPILADAVSQLRSVLTSEPIVLWISKAKAVVDQTYVNFSAGGKYAHLIEGFLISKLSELKPDLINDDKTATIFLTTVGAFNQKDKEDGALKVHQIDEDAIGDSLWKLLQQRTVNNNRRPLIIVYDEGHNLSDQQTDLLLELEPDVFLVASATMRTPSKLGKMIERLKDYGWSDDQLITAINSRDVVKEGLVKQQIILGGYATSLETALDDMVESMEKVSKKAKSLNAGFLPKAIYVCKTNISQEDGTTDNPHRPFIERKAPPILIWRHLVESKKINPKEIAVYCDLKFDRKNNPPPEDFILFSGGEDDFANFQSGNYRHIIFNQSLQEGWDDPECCFAYIDKSMGSNMQVEQVIGRVLRQPGAHHYQDVDLNSANFYIRIDNKQIFPEILDAVRRNITADLPDIKLASYSESRDREKTRLEPKISITLPNIHINTDEALICEKNGKFKGPFIDAFNEIIDYTDGSPVNIVGKGELLKTTQMIGANSPSVVKIQELKHSNKVTARWIMRRKIMSLYPKVDSAIDWSAPKFDAKIEIASPAAASLQQAAVNLVDAYIDHSKLTFEKDNLFTVGPIIIDQKKPEKFKNSIHSGYSGLNSFELQFAHAIDATGFKWARNPVSGGYSIPLLQIGDTRKFFPDFLIWKGKKIFCFDPKGDHLIAKDAGRKLFSIRDERGQEVIAVRLFTEGKWKDEYTKLSEEGFTVWALGTTGKPRPSHHISVEEAVKAALKD